MPETSPNMRSRLIGSFVAGAIITAAAAAILQLFVVAPKYALPVGAVISIDGNKSCQQTVGGAATPFAPVELPRTSVGGDTVVWSGFDAAGKDALVIVEFPKQSPSGGVGTPFYLSLIHI